MHCLSYQGQVTADILIMRLLGEKKKGSLCFGLSQFKSSLYIRLQSSYITFKPFKYKTSLSTFQILQNIKYIKVSSLCFDHSLSIMKSIYSFLAINENANMSSTSFLHQFFPNPKKEIFTHLKTDADLPFSSEKDSKGIYKNQIIWGNSF